MAYQYPLNGGRINASVGGNSTSAGAGYSLVSTGTLLLAGGNNITLSQNGSAITISGANAPSGSINFSASNTSANLASVTFSNSNGVSFGLNAGVITASHNALTSQSNQALSASNGSFAFQTAGFSNANGVTFGTSAGSIMTASVNTSYAASNHTHGNPTLNLTNISGTTASASNGLTLSLSAAAQSAQTQSNIQGIVASGSTNRTGDISFANSNGVTFGLSNNTITASVAAGGGGGGGVALSANAMISSGTASLAAAGALTASVNGQTLSLSVPAQSSLSVTGALSLSNNGSTISIGAPAMSSLVATGGISISTTGSTINIGTLARSIDFYQNMDRGTTATIAVPFASLMLQRLNQENDVFAANITANTVLLNLTANATATNLSNAHTMSVSIGIYSDNATNLSLINSASSSWALAANTSNSTAYHGPRWLSFVSSQWSSAPAFSQGGDYVFGVIARTSGVAPALSYYGQNYMISNQRSGSIGAAGIASTTMAQGNYWNAVMATTSLPSVISASQVNRNNASAIFMPHIILNNRYSGTF